MVIYIMRVGSQIRLSRSRILKTMEFPRTRVLILLVLASVSVLRYSSPHHHNNDILECLTEEFERSNLTTNVIFTPRNNASYASLLQSQNLRPASTSPLKPILIVTPYNESEIQAAVYCAKKLGLSIRTRSGGHDYEGLSYTSRTPFIIVDMRNLRSIKVDMLEKTAWVQTGATIGQLCHAVAKKSKTLAFPAGVCPTVGVGGQISGGGYGMLSRKYGLASDHIIDAIVIDADSRILDRGSMGEDLFWAIRGGGGASFAIIVAFKVTLTVVPNTVTVLTVTRTSEQNATRLVHRWQYISHKTDENLLLRVSMNSANPTAANTSDQNRTIKAVFTALYLGRINSLLPLMQREFPELGLVKQDCTEMTWIESVLYFANLGNQSVDVLLSRDPLWPFTPSYYKGKSDFVTKPIPVTALERIWTFLILHEEDENRGALEFSPYGGALGNISESETPFPHRAGNIFMIRYGVTWNREGKAELEKHLSWIRRLYRYMARHVTELPRAAYFNYKDLDIGINITEGNNTTSYRQAMVWGTKYFKNNFDRLVSVKTRVDPSNFFENEQSIPPLKA
ncbi:hypothetical protein OROGR_000899 [Orobanche gracilis]